MTNLTIMPGVERRDLAGALVASQAVLQAAIDNGVTDVVVVGRSRDGMLYLAAESCDADRTCGLLTRAAAFIASSWFGDSRVRSMTPDGRR
jgi:hypothetical protein